MTAPGRNPRSPEGRAAILAAATEPAEVDLPVEPEPPTPPRRPHPLTRRLIPSGLRADR